MENAAGVSNITWANETRRLGDLIPWPRNPVQISDRAVKGLTVSIDKFGLALPFLVSPDNDIYDGHQRQKILDLMGEYGQDAMIDVRVSNRPLTEKEREELAVRLRKNTGEFDFDILANEFEFDELIDWGFEAWQLGGYNGEQIDPNKEWEGMPEFEQEDKTSYQSIHVHFKNADEVKEFGELIGQKLTDKTRSIWYTEREQIDDGREHYIS